MKRIVLIMTLALFGFIVAGCGQKQKSDQQPSLSAPCSPASTTLINSSIDEKLKAFKAYRESMGFHDGLTVTPDTTIQKSYLIEIESDLRYPYCGYQYGYYWEPYNRGHHRHHHHR